MDLVRLENMKWRSFAKARTQLFQGDELTAVSMNVKGGVEVGVEVVAEEELEVEMALEMEVEVGVKVGTEVEADPRMCQLKRTTAASFAVL
jgi:hypothetical protein